MSMTRKSKERRPREGRGRAAEKPEADQLRWALRFAQEDLGEWRDGDWLNALQDAADMLFAGRQFPATGPDVYHIGEEKSVDRAKALLARLHPGLRQFVEGLYRGEPASVQFTGQRIFEPHPQGLSRGLVYHDISAVSDLKKGFTNEMILRVGDLLTRIDLSRLKRCPECKRLFLAVRRQRFDTPQCSLRDRVRRFRSKARPAVLSRKRRTRYPA